MLDEGQHGTTRNSSRNQEFVIRAENIWSWSILVTGNIMISCPSLTICLLTNATALDDSEGQLVTKSLNSCAVTRSLIWFDSVTISISSTPQYWLIRSLGANHASFFPLHHIHIWDSREPIIPLKNLPRHISFQISLHILLTFVHKDYGRATSLTSLTEKFINSSPASTLDDDYYGSHEKHPPFSSFSSGMNTTRANATFVMLARNSELEGAIKAVRSIEDRFNRGYRYPYVFLNDEPFTDEFKRFVHFFSGLLSSLFFFFFLFWANL